MNSSANCSSNNMITPLLSNVVWSSESGELLVDCRVKIIINSAKHSDKYLKNMEARVFQ